MNASAFLKGSDPIVNQEVDGHRWITVGYDLTLHLPDDAEGQRQIATGLLTAGALLLAKLNEPVATPALSPEDAAAIDALPF